MKNVVLRNQNLRCQKLEVDLNFDAYLPTEYIANEQAKIEIYKKLRKTETFDQIIDIKDELIRLFQ